MTKLNINNLLNGIATDYLNINDRAVQYGDGIFETILCNKNKLYYWQKHYLRLQLSAEKLNIPCPEESLLLNDIRQLLSGAKNGQAGSYAIKIILTRGAGERGYKYTKNLNPNRIVSFSSIESKYSSLLSNNLLSGVLFLCQQQVSINENLAGLKHLNRLENVLARNEWNDAAAAQGSEIIDGVMLNANQHIIEGTMSNIFAVKNQQIFTPGLMLSGVDGIMRNVVMDLASENNINVANVNLSLNELLTMDEVFICNSLIGMKAVTTFQGTTYTDTHISQIIFQALLTSMNNYVKNTK